MVSVDGGLLMRNNQQYKWSSGTAPTDSPDTGLARVAAGVVRVSDGSSGVGQTLTRVRIVAITGSGTPGATDSGTVYTNEGDADGAAVTLPNDPSYGQVFEFAIVVAQAFAISCSSGETIKDGTSSGTTITADAIGEGLRLVAITSGSGAIWAVMSKTGTWTIS